MPAWVNVKENSWAALRKGLSHWPEDALGVPDVVVWGTGSWLTQVTFDPTDTVTLRCLTLTMSTTIVWGALTTSMVTDSETPAEVAAPGCGAEAVVGTGVGSCVGATVGVGDGAGVEVGRGIGVGVAAGSCVGVGAGGTGVCVGGGAARASPGGSTVTVPVIRPG